MIIFLFAFLAVPVIGDTANSFVEFIIVELILSAVVLLIIPFMQGGAKVGFQEDGIAKKKYPRGIRLKDLLAEADRKEIMLWIRQYSIVILIYIAIWIMISIIHSVLTC